MDKYIYALVNPLIECEIYIEEINFTFHNLPFYIGKGTHHRAFKHIKKALLYNENKNTKIDNLYKCRKIIKIINQINDKNDKNLFKFHSTKINNIIKELTGNSMVIYIIEDIDNFKLFDIEKLLIEKLGKADSPNGILTNICDGGMGGIGRIVSESTKEKLRISSTGRIKSQQEKDKISLANKGKKHSIEVQEKIRKIRIDNQKKYIFTNINISKTYECIGQNKAMNICKINDDLPSYSTLERCKNKNKIHNSGWVLQILKQKKELKEDG